MYGAKFGTTESQYREAAAQQGLGAAMTTGSEPSTIDRAISESEVTMKVAMGLQDSLAQMLVRLEGERPTQAINSDTAQAMQQGYGGQLGRLDTTMTNTRMALESCHQLVGQIRRHV